MSDRGSHPCPSCAATLPAGARFCPSCGREAGSFAPTLLDPDGGAPLGVPRSGPFGPAPPAPAPPNPSDPEASSKRPAGPTPAGPTPAGVSRFASSSTAGSEPGGIPPMRLLPGTRLSVYRIESVLGEGGMGVVYRAHDEARDRTVALKCLHTNLSGDLEIRRRFAREARVLDGYRHPNVVGVYDFVEHEHLLAIVMEYVEGPSLVQHLAKWRGRMPFGEIRAIFGGVLDAMEAGHDKGIVHRDLKPDNILVTRGDDGLRPKVVDFGIAKILEGTTYTMTGALLGTCRYMSPEQVQRPERADQRSDIYSLGVTLYQIASGQVPFDSSNHFSVMMAHVHEQPKPPSALREDIPPALERLILDALAKDPAARPPSCAVFRARLEEALADFRAEPPPSRTSSLPPVVRGKDGEEMVLVPAGPFPMGPDRRVVHLDAFYLDRTPVTNLEFKTFIEVTGYRPTDEDAGRFLNHFRFGKMPPEIADHPVVYVSWHDARAYAAWAGKRLPTEAEWEKAARGTEGRKYPWGRTEPGPNRANYGKNRGGTTAVGAFPEGASPYGILDLAGNVWEWCEDYDDSAFYADGPADNPKNSRGGEKALLVMRGGSWMFGAKALRTYSRTGFEAHYRFASGGFRCARTP